MPSPTCSPPALLPASLLTCCSAPRQRVAAYLAPKPHPEHARPTLYFLPLHPMSASALSLLPPPPTPSPTGLLPHFPHPSLFPFLSLSAPLLPPQCLNSSAPTPTACGGRCGPSRCVTESAGQRAFPSVVCVEYQRASRRIDAEPLPQPLSLPQLWWRSVSRDYGSSRCHDMPCCGCLCR